MAFPKGQPIQPLEMLQITPLPANFPYSSKQGGEVTVLPRTTATTDKGIYEFFDHDGSLKKTAFRKSAGLTSA